MAAKIESNVCVEYNRIGDTTNQAAGRPPLHTQRFGLCLHSIHGCIAYTAAGEELYSPVYDGDFGMQLCISAYVLGRLLEYRCRL